MNLQHYIFGRRTPEFTAPHLLVAEHLNLKPHICLVVEHLNLKPHICLVMEHLILKFRHLFGCGTPDFKDKFEV